MKNFILTSFFCLLFLSCNQKKQHTVKIGLNPWPGYEFLYLAQVKGFFEDEGVHVKLIELGSLGDCRRSFEKDRIHIMTGTNIELLQVRTTVKKSAQDFYITDYSNGGDVILARQGINDIKQLKGKRIAAEANSLNVYILHRALELNSLKISDVEIVYLDQQEMEKAFAENKVDAVVSYPPVSVNVQNKFKTTQLFSSKDIPLEVLDILVADEEYIKSHPNEIKAVIRAVARAVEYASKNKDEAYGIMAKREKVSVEEFKSILENDIKIVPANEQYDYLSKGAVVEQALRKTFEVMKAAKMIRGEIGDAELQTNFGFSQKVK